MPQIREQIAMVHLPPSKTLKYLFHVRKTRQNNTMRSSAAASGVRSTDGVVFPFHTEPAAPGLISGIFFAYKSWERADQL